MILELNIGLHVQRAGADNSDGAVVARAGRAMRLLAETLALARIFSRVETTRYENDGQQVVERTLVVRAAVRGGRAAIRRHVYRVALALEQDCIAARWTDFSGATTGELIGPFAEAWGKYDEKFFTPYDNEQEQAA